MRGPVWLLVLLVGCAAPPVVDDQVCATFSIAAVDSRTGEIGIAVQSKVPCVGAIVPWARARVGGIATQSFSNTSYGPDGLALLSSGVSPTEVVKQLTDADSGRDQRQVGVVDAQGRAASYTGSGCHPWAGGVVGDGFCAQGNLLAGEAVVTEMARAFRETRGDLAERLLAALDAGQAAGGDRRGKQSAALLIVKEKGGYGGFNDRYRDIRVDDHKDPIVELRRVYEVHKRVFRGER